MTLTSNSAICYNENMKALTISQPYAHLIISGAKTVENRSWRTNYRGRLYIHAGKSKKWVRIPPDRLPLVFGAILGHVQLIDCVPLADAPPGPHTFGPWCWLLADPVMLDTPIPCNGRQGLWRIPENLL